jgi:CHAT domain-containing protein
MSVRRPAFLVLAVLFAAGGGIATQGADAPSTPLGQNLAGEACRIAGAPSISRAADIVCGSDAISGGTLRLSALAAPLPQDSAGRLATMTHYALALRSGDSGQMACDGGQWLGMPGSTALIMCTLSSNGWPNAVVVSAQDNVLYEADGLPAMFPVLAAAIGSASGHPVSADAIDAGTGILQAKVPHDVLHASSSDVANYKDFVEIGRLDGGSDDYAGAENAYRHALDIETRLFGADSAPVGETLAELALQVSNQGRFDEAAALFARATPILTSSSNPSAPARLASYLALDAANRRHFEDALKYARQATAAWRAEIDAATAADSSPDAAPVSRGELAHSLRIEAEMALRLADLASARAAAEESLWIVTAEPGLPLWWRPDTLALIGEINEREGRVVPAEHNFEDARDLDKKLFGDAAPTAAAELRLGAFYSGQQLYGPSLDAYREAFAILAKDPIARSHVVADQIVPFLGAAVAQTGASASLDADMFRASQLVNGGTADQTIARMAVRQAASNPKLAALVRQAQDAQRARDTIRIELAAESAKADDERDAGRVNKLTADLKVASARADALSANLAQAFPDYAKLADPGPAELAVVQAQLGAGEAFVSFVIGIKGSYGLLVTPHALKVRRLDIDSDALAQDVSDLRGAFVPVLGRLPAFSVKSSFALYQKLLGPFEADLAGIDHLTVAPSGDLENLPFSLLVTARPDSGYTDAAWLVRRMAVSQVPSARSLVALRMAEQTGSRAPDPFLGLGAPLFVGGGHASGSTLANLAGACLDGGPVAAATLRQLPPLPETAGEVNAVAHSLGAGEGSVLLGGNATEAGLRAHTLSNYAVLYFATHGLLPGELHCQSEPALALSPPAGGAASTNTDGLLTASEIAALKLNADLVVLSACNTASGGGGKFGGGALEGLADAFFDAGARAVLASHWQVPSAATVTLMTGLFRRMGADRTRGLAQALRESQLALIARPETAHPFNWAAFTLIGDGGALPRAAGEAAQSLKLKGTGKS